MHIVMRVAAAVCVLAMLALASSSYSRYQRYTAVHTTVDEQRTVNLTDGSIVHVNVGSTMRVDLTPLVRHIDLTRGEARFRVAKDPKRLFVVETPHARICAVATTFNVAIKDGRTAITVLEGHVEVSSRENIGTQSLPSGMLRRSGRQNPALRGALVLKEGQNASVGRNGIEPFAGPPLEQVVRWPVHWVKFDDKRLSAVVNEFNRYNPRSIRIADPELRGRQITGSINVYSPEAWSSFLNYLAQYEGIQVDEAKDGSTVLRASNGNSR